MRGIVLKAIQNVRINEVIKMLEMKFLHKVSREYL